MICYFLLLLLIALPALAQRAEVFDTSGMPRRPEVFVEQQIFDLIRSHKGGDLADAARLQRKLGSYYIEKNDQTRARAAFLAAAEAEAMAANAGTGGHAAASVEAAPMAGKAGIRENAPDSAPGGTRLAGNYFGFEGRTLHTWEFHGDGTFLHTWMASGSGTSVRSSERGRFRLVGDVLEIQLTSLASGFTTPGLGGRSTVAGGGAEQASQVRRMTIQWAVPGQSMVLDGIALKLKPW